MPDAITKRNELENRLMENSTQPIQDCERKASARLSENEINEALKFSRLSTKVS